MIYVADCCKNRCRASQSSCVRFGQGEATKMIWLKVKKRDWSWLKDV